MFQPVPSQVSFPKMEEETLRLWKEQGIYEKSLKQREGCPSFVFFEGPPTANGKPHPGHCLTRAVKDLFPRYKTMKGFYCRRKAGWDTHGLPVEVEVCKEMGIHSKEEIEAFGIEPFIQKCQQSVWRYMQEWELVTERLGFWLNLQEAYVTYHQSFIESVWWSLKQLFDRGLLYQGHKIVWWWAQGGTALSAGEVGQGYRELADPSVFVRFPLVEEPDTSLLVWTTTPWTLPSNQFAAVHPELEYTTVLDEETGYKLILATALVEAIAAKVKRELKPLKTCKGTDLIGKRYVPPFDFYRSKGDGEGKLKAGGKQHRAWRITAADFVTVDSGTGAVHEAPAFGEVDFQLLLNEQVRFEQGEGPEMICAVGPDGKFTDEAPPYKGRWVKECDRDITRNLKDRSLLFHQEQYLHEYPFCWRAPEDPLIQYPRRSWFIKTSQFKDKMLENNEQIQWLPEHIKNGRFGNFLETNVDWALSRERFWGTPLPIWVCDKTGCMEAVDSYDALLKKPGVKGQEVWLAAKKANPELVDDLRVHKPYIDAITYDSPYEKGATMRRVTEVIDCWYDSGAMPFAQWGYPHQGQKEFEKQFPADFISEALDQTRGWFYSQHAISTLLFPEKKYPHPFKTCIVLGLMLGEDGQKMSKSLRNYREPGEIFDKYGADALRWYFFATQPPWTTIRYAERAIKESIPEFLLRLWNVYSFFITYAKIDGFDPALELPGDVLDIRPERFLGAKSYRPIAKRGELDRWVLSELHKTVREVTIQMDRYLNYEACEAITRFVDALSNWYVRRSRDRFWSGDTRDVHKLDAYWTLYECLITLSKLIAPFTPFLAEALWRNLAGTFDAAALESVHLCNYPVADESLIDETLSKRMELLREIASLGRAARTEAKLKVRQPLSKVDVILADASHHAWLAEHDEILRDELNVKVVEYVTAADQFVDYLVQPNLKALGPRVGKKLPAVKTFLQKASGADLQKQLRDTGKVAMTVDGDSLEFTADDLQVRLQAKPGFAAAQSALCVVVLTTELTRELILEGLARDAIRAIQDRRKEMGCQFTDRIEVYIETENADLLEALTVHRKWIMEETLATKLELKIPAGVEAIEVEIGDAPARLAILVAKT
jgi:isoleucyl-tRNA synthetase